MPSRMPSPFVDRALPDRRRKAESAPDRKATRFTTDEQSARASNDLAHACSPRDRFLSYRCPSPPSGSNPPGIRHLYRMACRTARPSRIASGPPNVLSIGRGLPNRLKMARPERNLCRVSTRPGSERDPFSPRGPHDPTRGVVVLGGGPGALVLNRRTSSLRRTTCSRRTNHPPRIGWIELFDSFPSA